MYVWRTDEEFYDTPYHYWQHFQKDQVTSKQENGTHEKEAVSDTVLYGVMVWPFC